jgi:hypothetical protein
MRTSLLAVSLVLLAGAAHAATIPVSGTILSTATFPGQGGVSTPGPTITLPASGLLPTDTLSLSASGQVFLQGGNTYGTNAAGVVTTAGTSPVGGSLLNGSATFGALLLGNTTLGFHQIFATNAANGLGSSTPPSVVSISDATLSSLGFGSPISGGTVLQFMISDTFTSDNSGSFTFEGHFTTAAVPEPSTLGLLALGGALATSLRRRARRGNGWRRNKLQG